MKILFLNYEYPPLGGGAGVATEALLKEWKDEPNLEVHLVTSALGKKYEYISLGSGVHIHRLPIGKSEEKLHSQSFKDLLAYFFAALFFLPGFLRREGKKGKFDVTLAFFTVPCGSLAYFAKLFFGIPYALSLRGADVPGFSEKYDKLYFFLRSKIRFLWKRAARVIPNSPGLEALAKKTNSKQPMTIIENGIATDIFTPPLEPKTTERIVFLSTSRLTKRKRIDTLIRAFAEALNQSKVPLELRIISDGEERENLESLSRELGVSQQVKFLGRIPHEDLPRYYQEAHVFVLPSKNEGMSNSSLEALSSGLPLIVSRTGGMAELVQEGKNGLYVDPTHTKEFSEALLCFVREPELLLRYSEESRKEALKRSWKGTAKRFEELLKEVSRKRS